MLNDSVFYSIKTLKTFIQELLSMKKEVLGATENHGVEYHPRILLHCFFRNYNSPP